MATNFGFGSDFSGDDLVDVTGARENLRRLIFGRGLLPRLMNQGGNPQPMDEVPRDTQGNPLELNRLRGRRMTFGADTGRVTGTGRAPANDALLDDGLPKAAQTTAGMPDPYDPRYQAHPSFGKKLLANLADIGLGLLGRGDMGEAAKERIEGQAALNRQYGEDVFQARQAAANAQAAQKQQEFGEKSKLRGAQTFQAQSRGEEAEARTNKLKEAPSDKFERVENGQAIFTRPNGTSYAKAIEGYTAPQPKPPKGELDEWLAQHPGKTVDDFMARKAALGRKPEEPKPLSPSARSGIEGRKNQRLASLERQFSAGQIDQATLDRQKQQVEDDYENELRAGGATVKRFTYGAPKPHGAGGYKVGDTVTYQGQQYRITGITADGKLQLGR